MKPVLTPKEANDLMRDAGDDTSLETFKRGLRQGKYPGGGCTSPPKRKDKVPCTRCMRCRSWHGCRMCSRWPMRPLRK